MAEEWYYVLQGAELGPVDWNTLKYMVEHDQLDRNALVKQGQAGRWLLAKRVKGLVDLAAKPLILPGQAKATPKSIEPAASASPAPPASPRKVVPTMSFTAAKPANDIALPPMLASASKPQPPVPSPPTPTPAPPALSSPSPPKKKKSKKSIDDLLPPQAGSAK